LDGAHTGDIGGQPISAGSLQADAGLDGGTVLVVGEGGQDLPTAHKRHARGSTLDRLAPSRRFKAIAAPDLVKVVPVRDPRVADHRRLHHRVAVLDRIDQLQRLQRGGRDSAADGRVLSAPAGFAPAAPEIARPART